MLGLIHQEDGASLARDQVRQGLLAPLQRQVHKLAVLLHRKAAHDVGVLVRQDQRPNLLPRQLVELRSNRYPVRLFDMHNEFPSTTSSCMYELWHTVNSLVKHAIYICGRLKLRGIHMATHTVLCQSLIAEGQSGKVEESMHTWHRMRLTAIGRPSRVPSKTSVPLLPYPRISGPTSMRPTLLTPGLEPCTSHHSTHGLLIPQENVLLPTCWWGQG